jgi:Fe2+ transport system protein FeoA
VSESARTLALPMVGAPVRPDTTPCGTEVRLADVPLDQDVELVRIDLPPEQMEPLLERGVLPGCRLCPVRKSPSGDPIVLVDGSLIALRKEMAACLCVMSPWPAAEAG